MLPSGYISCVGVMPYSDSYIDTGIKSAGDLKVEALFSGAGYYTVSGYFFGARDSSSNTSAGQFAAYISTSSTCYWCYQSTRTSLGSGANLVTSITRSLHVHNDETGGEVIGDSGLVLNASKAQASFTGAQNIYVFALNNAGTYNSWSQVSCHGFILSRDGVDIYDGEPCYEVSSGKYGLYDRVSGTFARLSSARTMKLVTFTETDGGYGYARNYHKDYVKQIYGGENEGNGYELVQCVAVPQNGYVFVNWTDSNGNIVSTEKEFLYAPTANITLTAHFRKFINDYAKTGYKMLGIRYGSYSYEKPTGEIPSYRNDIYAEVISGDVEYDSLQRSTSTFILKDVPSLYQPYVPVFVFTPTGENIYQGIIWSIEGNKVTCREPLSIWDEEYLFKPTGSKADYVASRGLMAYLDNAKLFAGDGMSSYDYLGQRKHDDVNILPTDRFLRLQLREKDNLTVTTPAIEEVEVKNLEDFAFEIFQMGVLLKASLSNVPVASGDNDIRHYMGVKPIYYREYDELSLSDNTEMISNVSVTVEEMETTVLALFGSHHTDFKGYYSLNENYEAVKYDNFPYADRTKLIGYNQYKLKVISSDDKVKTTLAQNLTNSKYSHRITFDMGLDGELFSFDSIKVGQPIKFYYKDKMYDSIVTAIKYSIHENDDVIHSLSVTLGNVRTSLTSKLNMGKIK